MSGKILVVSLGSIGRRHLRNARKLLPEAEIAVLRRQADRHEGIPEGADALFHDMREALDFRPDAAIIASPASLHVLDATSLLEKGSHLFIEKPLAIACADLGGFAEAARAASRFVMVGYVLRFLPTLHFIRGLLRDGKVGQVRTAHVQVGQYLPDWRPSGDYRHGVSAKAALGGGALLELSHEIDYALWLFGNPDSLQCSLGRISGLEIDVEDTAHLILEYADPPKRVLVQLDFIQRVANMALQIVGSEGTLAADLIKETVRICTPAHPQGESLPTPVMADGNEIYLRQFDFFFAKSFPDYRTVFPETAGFQEWVGIDQAANVLDLVDRARLANVEGRRRDFRKVGR